MRHGYSEQKLPYKSDVTYEHSIHNPNSGGQVRPSLHPARFSGALVSHVLTASSTDVHTENTKSEPLPCTAARARPERENKEGVYVNFGSACPSCPLRRLAFPLR